MRAIVSLFITLLAVISFAQKQTERATMIYSFALQKDGKLDASFSMDSPNSKHSTRVNLGKGLSCKLRLVPISSQVQEDKPTVIKLLYSLDDDVKKVKPVPVDKNGYPMLTFSLEDEQKAPRRLEVWLYIEDKLVLHDTLTLWREIPPGMIVDGEYYPDRLPYEPSKAVLPVLTRTYSVAYSPPGRFGGGKNQNYQS